jgi:15-cis-phytoene synthase
MQRNRRVAARGKPASHRLVNHPLVSATDTIRVAGRCTKKLGSGINRKTALTGAMTGLPESLPMLTRLALSYAPKAMRPASLALFALDARLADTLRSVSEPMLAQIRLAWWRDMLVRAPDQRPGGEPLLAALEVWEGHSVALGALVDGWEELVGEDALGEPAMRRFCAGRGAAFAALAEIGGQAQAADRAQAAGEGWALADLAARLDNPGERETALALVGAHDWCRIALPRALRPLAVLHALAVREGRSGKGLGHLSPGTMFAAVRVGLFGR